jgi:UDPglucose--hexose-1-phosphate uridylyltransferase
MDIQFDTHNRYNPLLGEWVKVSPHRTKRPWNGQTEKPNLEELSRYDSTCYLCPGNKRSSGERNPEYKDVYVFDNDFASLLPTTPNDRMQTGPNGLLKATANADDAGWSVFHPVTTSLSHACPPPILRRF